MNFRIKKHLPGYVVEVQKTTWYGKKHWVTLFFARKDKSTPNYFIDYSIAEAVLLDEVKANTLINSSLAVNGPLTW